MTDNPEYPELPEPDTHCYDEDTGMDVWSYSADLVRKVIDSDRAMRTAPQGDVAAWLVLADGEPHHVTPGASDDAARLWAEDQTKCGSPYSFTFLPLCPPATPPQQAAPAAQGDALTVPADVLEAAKSLKQNDYRGPLAWAAQVIDFVAAKGGGDEYLASGTSWNRRTQTTPPAVVELLTDEQKFSRNPYKHSRSAASIWLNGFAAAELWYRIGIKKGDSHGLPT